MHRIMYCGQFKPMDSLFQYIKPKLHFQVDTKKKHQNILCNVNRFNVPEVYINIFRAHKSVPTLTHMIIQFTYICGVHTYRAIGI